MRYAARSLGYYHLDSSRVSLIGRLDNTAAATVHGRGFISKRALEKNRHVPVPRERIVRETQTPNTQKHRKKQPKRRLIGAWYSSTTSPVRVVALYGQRAGAGEE